MRQPTDASFDPFAVDYDRDLQRGLSATGESKDFFAQGRIEFLRKQLQQLHVTPRRILDFGCGGGTSVPLLLALPGATTLTGVDTSKGLLQMAAEKYGEVGRVSFSAPQDRPVVADIDLAFCNGVFHHIPPKQRPECLKYIFDSLRPGGIFALWENNPWNPGTRYVMSRIPFDRDAITLSPPECRGLVESAGFDLILNRFLFFFPKPLAFCRWMEPMLARIPLGGQYIVLCRKPQSSEQLA